MPTTDRPFYLQRQNHPYDEGYWARYDSKPRPDYAPHRITERQGWDDCNAEIDFEIRTRLGIFSGDVR